MFMELGFLVIVFYVIGTLLGGWIGYSCGKSNAVTIRRLRARLQELSDALEVRLQDGDFELESSRQRALGEIGAYYDLMNYIDGGLYDEE